MKKRTKILLGISIGASLLGTCLIGLGYAAGGIDDLKELTALEYTSETIHYDEVSDINLDLYQREVLVQTADSDTDKVTVTYYQEGSLLTPLTVSENSGKLSLSESDKKVNATGLLHGLGYLLNELDNKDFYQVVVTLPKGSALTAVTGYSELGTFKNLSLENIQYSGSLSLADTTIKQGTITSDSGVVNVNNSQISQLTLNTEDASVNVYQSTFDNLSTNTEETAFIISKSTIKNTQIKGDYGSLSISDGSLQDFSYDSEDGSFSGENITLLGNISLTGDYGSISLQLSDSSKDTTSINLSANDGTITVDTNLITSADASKSHITKSVTNSTATLSINSNEGSITVE